MQKKGEKMDYLQIAKEKFDALRTKKDVLILSIESSCDETAIAVVKNGRQVLANVISSQIEIHKVFGGVVPEVASRNHIKNIMTVFNEAISQANISLKDIDAVAVTFGAGLIGALLVGVNFSKTLAYALKIPLIAVSHVHGHIGANYISHKDLEPPFLCLMVSGGHTALVEVKDFCDFHVLGSTVDDSVGECFDKVARVLGLSYPGGPNIEKLAKNGQNCVKFNYYHTPLEGTLNFSFSGLKTAVVNYVHTKEQKNEEFSKADIANSFQELAVEELSHKAILACKKTGLKNLVIAGGVGANKRLREKLYQECEKIDVKVFAPDLLYCTDNGAMIGSIAYYYIRAGKGLADLSLTAVPTVRIDE